jgi:hypothetical protein
MMDNKEVALEVENKIKAAIHAGALPADSKKAPVVVASED